MDLALKYRIVGAAVLLSLAVIFIPMILDGSGKDSVTTIDMEIPPEPTLVFSDEIEERVQTPAPEHTAKVKSSEPEEAVIDVKENVLPEVVVNKNTKPELLSWVVQVGAFGEREKAIAMQNKLLEAKFDALVEVGKSNGKDYFRVKAGPVISQDEAIKLKDKLKKKLKLDSAFVTRYPKTSE